MRFARRGHALTATIVGTIVAGLLGALILSRDPLGILSVPLGELLWRVRPAHVKCVIPDASIIEMSSRHMPFPLAAALVEKAQGAGAKAIVLVPPGEGMNVRFLTPSAVERPDEAMDAPPAEDRPDIAKGLQRLRSIVATSPRVFVVYRSHLAVTAPDGPGPTQVDRIGHFLPTSHVGNQRLVRITIDSDGTPVPGVAAAIAAYLEDVPYREIVAESIDRLRIGQARIPLAGKGRLLVAREMSAGPTRTVRIFEPKRFHDTGLSADGPVLDTTWGEFCRDKVVLIGTRADFEIGAPTAALVYRTVNTLVAQMRRARGEDVTPLFIPAPMRRSASIPLVWVVALAMGLIGFYYRPLDGGGILLLIGIALLSTAATVYLLSAVILPVPTVLVAGLLSGLFAIEASHLFVERQRDRVRSIFGRYVSEDVAKQILGARDVVLGGESRKATILFADIRGFGLTAEALAPDELVALVNDYFSVMIDVVFEFGGTLDKFIGDAVMAVWGAPFEAEDDAARASQAAIAICQRTDALSRQRAARGLPTVTVAVGVNTGEVVAGNIGDLRRTEYTVIGDGVNVAARLQGIASVGPARIVMSETTYQEVRDLIDARPLGAVEVKHRTQPVAIYEAICGGAETAGPSADE